MWGTVLKRDLLGETREEDKFHTWGQLQEYIESEIKKQGENVVIRDLDVSLIDDLSELFRVIAYGVKTLDLSGWKTSGVKCMSDIFYNCRSLESLNVSGWDTSNVEDMSGMFYNCINLKSLNVSGWDTSKVGNMGWMFYGCTRLKSLDLSNWNTSNVESMINMFADCPAPYKVVSGNRIVRK